MLIDVALNRGSSDTRQREIVVARPPGARDQPPSLCGSLNAALGRIEAGAAEMQSGAEAEAGSRYANYAKDIVTASQHLSRVLAGLWQEDEAGAEPQNAPFRVFEALDEAVRFVRPLRAAKGIEIAVDVEGEQDSLLAFADRRLVQQILLNLLSNALKFGPVGSRLRVSLAGGECVRIRVADAGPGIPPEDRERIFAPFERLRSEQEGMGLGLAISRRYAEAMNGRLYAEDSELGGAALVLELPLA